MQTSVGTLLLKYNPFDPETKADPYRAYAMLRKAGPICRGGPGQWVVTKHAPVAELLRDTRLGHQFIDKYHRLSEKDGVVAGFFQNIIFERDPPRHTLLRQFFSKALDQPLLQRIQTRISDFVDELLAPILDKRQFDAVQDLAFPLPIMVVGELLGIPKTDLYQFHAHAKTLLDTFDMRFAPGADRTRANEAVVWLREYLGELLKEREKKPQEDLLSRMAAVKTTPPLSQEEIIDNAIFMFFSGLETSKDLIATGCAALLQNPLELKRLRNDRSLMLTAVEEFLRYDAPIQALARLALQPIEIAGRTIRSGRIIVLLLGSANHDEDQFPGPERLDVGRKPNPHVSFGAGSYYCLGASLTRTEAATAFDRILTRFPTFEPAGEPVRRPSATFRSYESVPISAKAQ